MLSIKDFFSRWKNKELEESILRFAVIEAIRDVLRYDVDEKAVSYSDGTVSLKISPAAKSAILLKKTEILTRIKHATTRKIVDIK